MKNYFVFMLSLYLLLTNVNVSNADDKKHETDQFSGDAIVNVFSNWHTGFGDADGDRGFEISRAYLGYQFKYGDGFSGKIVFDVGTSGATGATLDRIGYLKNAFLTYKTGRFSLNAGLIGLEQFNLQEKFWGRRYIFKSFQDEYKFGTSADLGLLAKYQFSDAFSIDLTCVNGEGYKKENSDKGMRYGAGITFNPTKNFTLRAYADNYDVPEGNDAGKSQNTIALFAGYKNEIFSLGAEYNMLNNTKFTEKHNLSGVSVYGDVKVDHKINLFARWDMLGSCDDWNEANDGSLALFGLEYAPIKHIKISPNVRAWMPKSDNADTEVYTYLNLQFSL